MNNIILNAKTTTKNRFMKYFLSLFALVLSLNSFGQITAWHDSIDCSTTFTTLRTILVGDVPTSAGITSDDGYSGVIPLGFTYNYYGNNYTQCVIGSNGNISFNTGLAGGYCPWPISAVLLGNASMYNSICGPWCDIFIPGGGTITYSTIGTAPNRKFMATWCHTRMYSCTTQWITTQIIIYETTNLAEVHVGHKTICAWNGGYAIIGVQNSTGSSATVAPGRDFPAVYNCTNEAWRFTPVGTSTFTVASIPYAPVPYSSSLLYWYDSTTGAFLGTGDTLRVAPIVPTTYKVCALGCDDTTFTYVRVPAMPGLVGGGSNVRIRTHTFTHPSHCGACDGSIKLYGVNPHEIDTIFISYNGVLMPRRVDSALLDSTITISGLCEGIYNYVYLKVGNCPSNPVGPDTLHGPLLIIRAETATNPTLCGACDGTIKLYGLWAGYPVTLSYTKDGVPQIPYIGTVASDSTITLTGLHSGLYAGFTAVIDSCIGSGTPIRLTDPILSISSVDKTNPTICGKCDATMTLHGLPPGIPVRVTAMRGTTPIGPITGTIASDSTFVLTDLCAGTYTSISAAIFTCSAYTCSANAPVQTLVNPAPIPASFTDSIKLGCSGDEVWLKNTSTPSGYTAYWTFGDGSPMDSSYNAYHFFNDAPSHIGTYSVKLVYMSYNNLACRDSMTKSIVFNHPIGAAFTADKYDVCIGVPVTFSNDTSLSHDGPTYLWNFGNGATDITTSPVYTFPLGGTYNVSLTVTDTIGCTATANATVNVVSIDVHTSVNDTLVCLVDSMHMRATTTLVGAVDSITYAWTSNPNPNYLSGADGPTPGFFSLGDYVYTVNVTTWPLGCTASDTEAVHSFPPVTLTDVTASTTIPYGGSIHLNADGAYYYLWAPDNGSLDNPNINNPIATPLDSVTVYTVYGMSLYGCLDSASVTIRVDNSMLECMPSAFTPNSDGINDVFRLTKLKYQKLVDFRIFNRWGQVVFQTANPEMGWDGNFQGVPQDLGDYNYHVIVAKVDGTNVTYKGTVTLVR